MPKNKRTLKEAAVERKKKVYCICHAATSVVYLFLSVDVVVKIKTLSLLARYDYMLVLLINFTIKLQMLIESFVGSLNDIIL